LLLAAQVVHAVAARYGLTVNFAQGKTEVLLAPRGKGAPAVRALLAATRTQEPSFLLPVSLLPLGNLGQLRMVQAYKHLGSSVLATGHLAAEWALRANLANAMTGAMAKTLSKDDTLSLASRSALATASVHSRLLFAAGTWELPPKA